MHNACRTLRVLFPFSQKKLEQTHTQHDMTWTITINELLMHRGGTSVFSTFSVKVEPTITVDDFIKIVRTAPDNADWATPDNPNSFRVYTDGLVAPNYSWDPAPGRTLVAAGLTDGAILSYVSRRVAD